MHDSKEYLEKKAFFDKVLTIYGRNAVMEALENGAVTIHKLHFSKSNKDATILENMKKIARQRKIEIVYHDKQSLSRISKNAKQDQGVALMLKLLRKHMRPVRRNKSLFRRSLSLSVIT